MPGITALASRRTVSAGAVLVFAGAVALYQMTSLVLGPAGSRELHLSLAIPAADVDELSAPGHVGVNDTLATLAGPAPAPTLWSQPTAPASGKSAVVHATPPVALPAPVVASPPSPPVASPPPCEHHRAPPKRHDDH